MLRKFNKFEKNQDFYLCFPMEWFRIETKWWEMPQKGAKGSGYSNKSPFRDETKEKGR